MQQHFLASPIGSDSGENDHSYMLNHSSGVSSSRHPSSSAVQESGLSKSDDNNISDRRTLHMIIEENKQ